MCRAPRGRFAPSLTPQKGFAEAGHYPPSPSPRGRFAPSCSPQKARKKAGVVVALLGM